MNYCDNCGHSIALIDEDTEEYVHFWKFSTGTASHKVCHCGCKHPEPVDEHEYDVEHEVYRNPLWEPAEPNLIETVEDAWDALADDSVDGV